MDKNYFHLVITVPNSHAKDVLINTYKIGPYFIQLSDYGIVGRANFCAKIRLKTNLWNKTKSFPISCIQRNALNMLIPHIPRSGMLKIIQNGSRIPKILFINIYYYKHIPDEIFRKEVMLIGKHYQISDPGRINKWYGKSNSDYFNHLLTLIGQTKSNNASKTNWIIQPNII